MAGFFANRGATMFTYAQRWRRPGWKFRLSMLSAGLIIVPALLVLGLAIIAGIIVGVVVFAVLSLLSGILMYPVWLLRGLFGKPVSDGRENVRVIVHQDQNL